MDQADDIAITRETEFLLGSIVRFVSVRIKEPVVVGILVVVTCNLLLVRAVRISLVVRVQKTSSVTHILQSCT